MDIPPFELSLLHVLLRVLSVSHTSLSIPQHITSSPCQGFVGPFV